MLPYSLLKFTFRELKKLWRLLPNSFFKVNSHVKVENERFTDYGSRFLQNLKNLTSSFGRLRQNIPPKSLPQVQYYCFSSFNQSVKSLICGQVAVAVAVLVSLGSFSNNDRDGKKNVTCVTVTILRLSHLVRILQC